MMALLQHAMNELGTPFVGWLAYGTNSDARIRWLNFVVVRSRRIGKFSLTSICQLWEPQFPRAHFALGTFLRLALWHSGLAVSI